MARNSRPSRASGRWRRKAVEPRLGASVAVLERCGKTMKAVACTITIPVAGAVAVLLAAAALLAGALPASADGA